MVTQFYRWQTEPQGDEGALGRLGNSRQSWKGMVKLSDFSSKQFPTMKPYSLLCQRKLLHDAEMCQAIQYTFLSTHFEYGACSYFEISLVSTGIWAQQPQWSREMLCSGNTIQPKEDCCCLWSCRASVPLSGATLIFSGRGQE